MNTLWLFTVFILPALFDQSLQCSSSTSSLDEGATKTTTIPTTPTTRTSKYCAMSLAITTTIHSAWVPTALYYNDMTLASVKATRGVVNRLWDLPDDVVSSAGLRSGITYAWDPELCAEMLPLFSEDISGISFMMRTCMGSPTWGFSACIR